MQKEVDEYYNDAEVYKADVEKFRQIVSTIDIAKYSQREFCSIVDEIFNEIFLKEEIYDEEKNKNNHDKESSL
tara:strand:+ start:3415 stop:3633 length:219 start_codon:yes stop_codon:yes gene_type:complete